VRSYILRLSASDELSSLASSVQTLSTPAPDQYITQTNENSHHSPTQASSVLEVTDNLNNVPRKFDGKRYVVSSSHSHHIMPGQAVPYLPQRSEFLFVLVLTLGIVGFILFQLQIINCWTHSTTHTENVS